MTTANAAGHPLSLPAFRWFWLGQGLVMLAVQGYLVALSWTVLATTGSGATLGMVLTAAAVPRALLMLVGGAISDRLPPRAILWRAALANGLVVGALALFHGLDWFVIWQLYLLAALSGAAEAFFYPAAMAQLPRLLAGPQLSAANAVVQGTEQLTTIAGPVLGGMLLATRGTTATFAALGLVFVAGALLLAQSGRSLPRPALPDPGGTPAPGLARSIGAGLRYAWGDPGIRASLGLIAAMNLAGIGPVIVGGAVLAERYLGQGAAGYGWLLAAYGGGALLGVALAGLVGRPAHPGRRLIALAAVLGVLLGGLGLVTHPALIYGLLALMGVGGGLIGVDAVTWLQARTAPEMQGRVMSLLFFAAVALDPLSQAAAGFLLGLGLPALFLAAGGLLVASAALAAWTNARRV